MLTGKSVKKAGVLLASFAFLGMTAAGAPAQSASITAVSPARSASEISDADNAQIPLGPPSACGFIEDGLYAYYHHCANAPALLRVSKSTGVTGEPTITEFYCVQPGLWFLGSLDNTSPPVGNGVTWADSDGRGCNGAPPLEG